MLGTTASSGGAAAGGGGSGAFTPAILFVSAQAGGWWDVSDLPSMFQTTDTSTPAVVNSPVGRISDKSGNLNHLLQLGMAARPILRSVGGLYWLETDGANDNAGASFALAQPCERISALRQVTYASNTGLVTGGGGTGDSGILNYAVSPEICLFDGAVACTNAGTTVGADFVASEVHNGAASSLTVNNGMAATGNPGARGLDGMRVGSFSTGGSGFSNMRFYGAVARAGAFTTAERANLRTFLGAKAGLVL